MKQPLHLPMALVLLASLLFAGAASLSAGASPQPNQDPKSILDRIYSEPQAQRGEQQFKTSCSSCHTPRMFTGGAFAERWNGQSMGNVFEWVSVNMPENDPGGLKPQQYADILAFVLGMNGYPVGSDDMPADVATLKQYAIVENPK
jgi:mono/diheme cytochrome c family protein